MRLFLFAPVLLGCRGSDPHATPWQFSTTREEPWRNQVHYAPAANWLNDPNGLVFHRGEWHLFYQHQPDLPIWGPMHWGHAVSPDRVHWTELDVALYPDDTLGAAFSGTAISDEDGHTGLCEEPCILAWFTHDGGDDRTQKQSLAIGTDRGRTWTLHPASPVLENPGVPDFRDPRVFEFQGGFRMAVAAGDHVAFYRSDDGLDWTWIGDFTSTDAPVATWECPELVGLTDEEGVERWVLAVSFLEGGPQGGSGVGWFLGDFDGDGFSGTWMGWADHGADFYAAQAWTGEAVWTAWASNWAYALTTPTDPWRGSMAIPRQLSLRGDRLVQEPIDPGPVVGRTYDVPGNTISSAVDLPDDLPAWVELTATPGDEQVELVAYGGDVRIGFGNGELWVDRTGTDAPSGLTSRHTTAVDTSGAVELAVLLDWSLVEVFADRGAVVMTEQVFPDPDARGLVLEVSGPVRIDRARVDALQSIWAP